MAEQSAAQVGKQCWATLEAVHILAYFAPEPTNAYRALGMRGRQGYFASRSAPMGAVPGEVVQATFYVFSPAMVLGDMATAWEIASPEKVLAARHESVLGVLRNVFAELDSAYLEEVVGLTRRACEGMTTSGRALYAGHASLPWPEEPLLALWHAASLVREHRGDGHMATLLSHGLSPLQSMVTYGKGSGMLGFLKATRGYLEQEWESAFAECRERGWLEGEELSDAGRALRRSIEDSTDSLGAEPWEHLGLADCNRLRDLLQILQQPIIDSGILPGGVVPSTGRAVTSGR